MSDLTGTPSSAARDLAGRPASAARDLAGRPASAARDLAGRPASAARDLAGRPAPLGIPADLWDLLACPCDAHGPVEADVEAGEIVCTVCKRRFPVRDGIPVMLLDEATQPA